MNRSKMRLFQVLEDGTFREVVTEGGRISGVQEAVGLARNLGEDGTFIADYTDGQVLHFQVSQGSALGVGPQNIRNLPMDKTPGRVTDIQNGKVDLDKENQISSYGAIYPSAKGEEPDGSLNAVEEL